MTKDVARTEVLAELRTLPLFERCSEHERRVVAAAVRETRTVAAGDPICLEGDPADRWWLVADGMADVTVGGRYLATIGPGETIGELALLDGEPRAATVTAATEMTVHEIEGGAFVDALVANPSLAVALLRELAARLRATNLQPPAPHRPSAPSPTVRGPARPFDGVREERGGIAWCEELSSLVVTRYDDVHRLMRSRSAIGSITTVGVPDPGEKPRPGHRMLINRDGDDHTRLRRLVSKVFTPRAISQWQARAETIVAGLLAAADERDELDVIADYALPLPATVITEMLGLPPDDTPVLRQWSRTLTLGLEPSMDPSEQAAFDDAGRRMGEYLEAVIAAKRSAPGEDILSDLLRAEDAGDVLSDNEVLAQVVLLYIAGHETTLNLIGNGVVHLLARPDQLAWLREDPDLDANAVEEVLRIESPAQLTRRIALEDLDIGGVPVPAGSHLTLSLGSANHDPRKWGSTADLLDIGRTGANEHVSFGGGAHYCLGASLARLEARAALPRLVRRFPAIAPAYDEPAWLPRLALRGVASLPVTLR